MSEQMKARIIRTDGTEEDIVADFAAIKAAIRCDYAEAVNLRDGRTMLVDEDGYDTVSVPSSIREWQGLPIDFAVEVVPYHGRKPVNPKATALYHGVCIPGTTHKIVGDVAIVATADFK